MDILVLDNLSALGSTFGVPMQPWSPDLVGKALDVLAILHGSTWDRPLPRTEWLTVGWVVVRQALEFLLSEQNWTAHFDDPECSGCRRP